MKNNDLKVQELERIIQRQSRIIDSALRRIAQLEKENVRRRNEVDRLKK